MFQEFVRSNWGGSAEGIVDYFYGEAQIIADSLNAKLDQAIILDGTRHYLPNSNGKRDQKAYYIGSTYTDKHGNEWPAVTFGTFKEGHKTIVWKPQESAYQLFQSNQPLKKPIKDVVKKIHLEVQKAQVINIRDHSARFLAAKAARKLIENATKTYEHNYADAKGISKQELLVLSKAIEGELFDPKKQRAYRTKIGHIGDLLIPMQNLKGDIVGVQKITPTGQKRFLQGMVKKGSFYTIEATKESQTIYLCEGWATGVSIAEVTGCEVRVCFDAHNLLSVAADLGEELGTRLIVAADNDHCKAQNTGLTTAFNSGLRFVVPQFEKPEGSDWNDFLILNGREKTFKALQDVQAARTPPLIMEHEIIKGTLSGFLRTLRKTKNLENAVIVAKNFLAKGLKKCLSEKDIEKLGESINVPILSTSLQSDLINWTKILFAISEKKLSSEISFGILARHNVTYVDSLKDIDISLLQNGVNLVKACMGSGKTQIITQNFSNAIVDYGGFLSVTHRVSLVNETARRLNLINYKDIDKTTSAYTDRTATCLPSLLRVDHQRFLNETAGLSLDEISQVLRFITAEQCRIKNTKSSDVHYVLKTLFSKCQAVLGTDAHINDYTIERLEQMMPGVRFNIFICRQKPEQKNFKMSIGQKAVNATMLEILSAARAKEKLYIAVERTGDAQVLKTYLEENTTARVIEIRSNNKDNPEQKRFLNNPEAESLNYDVVIVSPIISSGVSIEHLGRHHFTKGFFIGSGEAIMATDAIQMINRVRYLKDWTIALYGYGTNFQVTAEFLTNGFVAVSALQGSPKNATEYDKFNAKIKEEESFSKAYYARHLCKLLKEDGHQVQLIENDVDIDPLKEIRKAQKAKNKQQIVSAENLSDNQAINLEAQQEITEEEHHALEKHKIAKALNVETEKINTEHVEVYDKGAGVRKLQRFAAYLDLIEDKKGNLSDNLTERSYSFEVTKSLYKKLLRALQIKPGMRITQEIAADMIPIIKDNHAALYVQGMIGPRINKKPLLVAKELFAKMGLKLTRRRVTIKEKGKSVASIAFYELSDADYAWAMKWVRQVALKT